MRIAILEDEPVAAARITRLLKLLRPEWEITGVAATVKEAVQLLSEENLDAAFCDIHLSDGLSFEALKKVNPQYPVVFVTAYDQYAIKAFDHLSLDYLVKPLQEEFLLRSIERMEEWYAKTESRPKASDMKAVIEAMTNLQKSGSRRYLVKVGDKLKFFEADDVLSFFSEDKTTYLYTPDHRKYPIDKSIDELAEHADPKRFFRINRGFIVSSDAIDEISIYSNSRLRLSIKGMADVSVVVAREKVAAFKNWLGA